MYEKELPFGEPIFFQGEYKQDKVYSLYIQMITCSFKSTFVKTKQTISFCEFSKYSFALKKERLFFICIVGILFFFNLKLHVII